MAKSDSIMSVEDEVLANLRRQPLGRAEAGTVADLNLPLEFLRRVADRVIQSSFRERHRIVVGNVAREHAAPGAAGSGPLPGWVRVLPARAIVDRGWTECRPGVRGFRAPILGGVEWPLEVPAELAAAARVVNGRLALDGLTKTVLAVGVLGANADEAAAKFRAVGVPTDLSGVAVQGGFEAAAENGFGSIGVIRVQLTGPGYYEGIGDGGSLDILRQLMAVSPGVAFVASVEERHVAGVLGQVRSWTPAEGTTLVVIPEALPVAQWAQDNTKAGYRVGEATLLAPRWAGRGEAGGIFVPGENALIDGLPRAGLKVSQSAMLFEGGNLMLVREPGGRRVLLVGEAEVCRNVGLGLARPRVLEMFCAEFGADICAVLPASSFHIDLEVTTRTHEGRVLAFVPDTMKAVRTICGLAAEKLAAAGMMSSHEAEVCGTDALPKVFAALASALWRRASGPGQYPLSMAEVFRSGEVDSGVGNLQRILFAHDWLGAELIPPSGYPVDRHAAAYLRSLRRAEADRRALQRQLRGLGWEVVPVPAISSEEVSINSINGVQDARRYLMPAYGGFFEPLDREAEAAFAAALGSSVEIVPILTGETQRRGGGLHCAVSAMAGL